MFLDDATLSNIKRVLIVISKDITEFSRDLRSKVAQFVSFTLQYTNNTVSEEAR